MDTDNLIIGHERLLTEMVCPECGCSERICQSDGDQFAAFDCVYVDENGTIHVWDCKNCGRRFKVVLQ